jgi:hypothetical protein
MRTAVEPLSKDARPKSGEIAIAAESFRDLVGIDDLVQPDLFRIGARQLRWIS